MDTREQNRAAALRLHSAVVDRAAELNISLRQVAVELHMSSSTLTRLQGGHMPTWARAVQLMRWAGVGVDDLSSDVRDGLALLGLEVERLMRTASSCFADTAGEAYAASVAEGTEHLSEVVAEERFAGVVTVRLVGSVHVGRRTDGAAVWSHSVLVPWRLSSARIS